MTMTVAQTMSMAQWIGLFVLLVFADTGLAILAPRSDALLTLFMLFNGGFGAFVKAAASNSQESMGRRTIADVAAGAVVGGLYNKLASVLGFILSTVLPFGAITMPAIDASWNQVQAGVLVFGVGYVGAHLIVNVVDKFHRGDVLLGKLGIKSISPPKD